MKTEQSFLNRWSNNREMLKYFISVFLTSTFILLDFVLSLAFIFFPTFVFILPSFHILRNCIFLLSWFFTCFHFLSHICLQHSFTPDLLFYLLSIIFKLLSWSCTCFHFLSNPCLPAFLLLTFLFFNFIFRGIYKVYSDACFSKLPSFVFGFHLGHDLESGLGSDLDFVLVSDLVFDLRLWPCLRPSSVTLVWPLLQSQGRIRGLVKCSIQSKLHRQTLKLYRQNIFVLRRQYKIKPNKL